MMTPVILPVQPAAQQVQPDDSEEPLLPEMLAEYIALAFSVA